MPPHRAQIGSGTSHRIQFDMAAHILDSPTGGEDQGQTTRELVYQSFHDATRAKAFEFQITNTLATLS